MKFSKTLSLFIFLLGIKVAYAATTFSSVTVSVPSSTVITINNPAIAITATADSSTGAFSGESSGVSITTFSNVGSSFSVVATVLNPSDTAAGDTFQIQNVSDPSSYITICSGSSPVSNPASFYAPADGTSTTQAIQFKYSNSNANRATTSQLNYPVTLTFTAGP